MPKEISEKRSILAPTQSFGTIKILETSQCDHSDICIDMCMQPLKVDKVWKDERQNIAKQGKMDPTLHHTDHNVCYTYESYTWLESTRSHLHIQQTRQPLNTFFN